MKHSLIVITSVALMFNYAYGAEPPHHVYLPSSHTITNTNSSGSSSTSGSTATGGTSTSGSNATGGNSTANGGQSTSSTGASTSNSSLSNRNANSSGASGNGSNNPTTNYSVSNSLTTENCKVAMVNAGKPFLLSLCDEPNATIKPSAEYVPSAWSKHDNQEEVTKGMTWSGHIIGEDNK